MCMHKLAWCACAQASKLAAREPLLPLLTRTEKAAKGTAPDATRPDQTKRQPTVTTGLLIMQPSMFRACCTVDGSWVQGQSAQKLLRQRLGLQLGACYMLACRCWGCLQCFHPAAACGEHLALHINSIQAC